MLLSISSVDELNDILSGMKKEEEALVNEAFQISKLDGFDWQQALHLGKKERKHILTFLKNEKEKRNR